MATPPMDSANKAHVPPAKRPKFSLPSVNSAPKVELGLQIQPEKKGVVVSNEASAMVKAVASIASKPEHTGTRISDKIETLFTTRPRALGEITDIGSFSPTFISGVSFEAQRKTFMAIKPTPQEAVAPISGTKTSGDRKMGAGRRKIEDRGRASDLDGFKGPWARYADEQHTAHPSTEQYAQILSWNLINPEENPNKDLEGEDRLDGDADEDDDIKGHNAKTKKKKKSNGAEKTSILHIGADETDYQGRTFMDCPAIIGTTRLDSTSPPAHCHLPTKSLHTWIGHTKGVSAIRLFPKTGHLLLSASLDGTIKLWEYYNRRRCIRTYTGHTKAVKDICFNHDGKQFISCGYDCFVLLWDTYSGECLGRYVMDRIPNCLRFHPSLDFKTSFLVGVSDSKILQFTTETREIVQQYNYHQSAINSLTFLQSGQRFVSTSDDNTLRVWEWEVPAEISVVKSHEMCSMPAVAAHPTQDFLACQSMDNQIVVITTRKKYAIRPERSFRGHASAGYAIQPAFSPDGRYLASGDASGKLFFWVWSTGKLTKKVLAHKDVVIAIAWHPHEASHLVSASWDGSIRLWV